MAMELTALDKLEIMELAARFEIALDREDVESYLDVYAEDGMLEVFGQVAQGKEALRTGFWQMLDIFARGRRHCSANHIVEGNNESAVMTSYLNVVNRSDLGRAGSALITDVARRQEGKWLLVHRHIEVDPSLKLRTHED